MSMVCGLDLHRGQITFDALIPESGEVWRGRIWSPDRVRLRRWLAEEVAVRCGGGRVDISVEGCTGWRYVVEEITAAGFVAHMAEPADTQAARGRKRRAKTDRSDSCLQRQLLASGELPESWIPPAVVLEWRERTRIYKTLVDQRRIWCQRIHAELFQHGVPVLPFDIRSADARAWIDSRSELSAAGRERVAIGYRMVDAVQAEIDPLRHQLRRFAVHQPACRVLMDTYFGVGPVTAVVAWVELGDCGRFARSEQAVRLAGLDISVDQSDLHRAGGHLVRQGPPTLRWALYESAKCASRPNSPDHDYYLAVKARHGGKIATISVARKLARRCYHTLKAVPPEMVYATD